MRVRLLQSMFDNVTFAPQPRDEQRETMSSMMSGMCLATIVLNRNLHSASRLCSVICQSLAAEVHRPLPLGRVLRVAGHNACSRCC